MLPTDTPPDSGLIQIEVPAPPVSFQAAGTKKTAIREAIRGIVSPCAYLLAGDVQIEIEWEISERARYESDGSADVDNIVKPMLDALCGPDGILIDDCQVQALTCYWTGGYSYPEEESLRIVLRFEPGAYQLKEGLVFLHLERNLYFPIHDNWPAEAILTMAENLVTRFPGARELTAAGMEEDAAHMTLPIQRVFHRSKLGIFRTTTIEELRRRFA